MNCGTATGVLTPPLAVGQSVRRSDLHWPYRHLKRASHVQPASPSLCFRLVEATLVERLIAVELAFFRLAPLARVGLALDPIRDAGLARIGSSPRRRRGRLPHVILIDASSPRTKLPAHRPKSAANRSGAPLSPDADSRTLAKASVVSGAP